MTAKPNHAWWWSSVHQMQPSPIFFFTLSKITLLSKSDPFISSWAKRGKHYEGEFPWKMSWDLKTLKLKKMRCLQKKGRGCVLRHITLKVEEIPFALILQANALKSHRIFPAGYIFVKLSVCRKYKNKVGSDSHLLRAGLFLVPKSYWTADHTEDECQWKAA